MSELTIQNTKDYTVMAIYILFYFCNGNLIFLAPEHAGCNNQAYRTEIFAANQKSINKLGPKNLEIIENLKYEKKST